MAITTTEYANFEKKAFFDNREWLNQENWQMYFGGSLPSGVLVDGKLETSGIDYTSALSRQLISSSYIQFRAGSILANGIYASFAGGISIPTIRSSEVDRLFVARVYITAGNVKIVGMTKIAAEYGFTPAIFAKMLLQDESLAMSRNTTYYDIPLLYEIFGGDSYDLRRLIYLPGQAPDCAFEYNYADTTNTGTIPGVLYGRNFMQIYGGMNYICKFKSTDTADYFYIYPHPACSEKSASVKLENNSSVAKQIRIPLLWKSMQYSYSWLESWETDPNSRYLYKELVAGDKMTLIFTQNGHQTAFDYIVTNKSSVGGGSIDPEDYFTKQEISALLLLKANVDDVDNALALKENITNLHDLAYQNSVNYITQVDNKPTLGALAGKDQANLTTDVTGILPIENGGTGANNLVGIMSAIIGEGKTYYVSPDGNDNNSGTSASPFRTIQKAVDSSGLARTIIMVRDGIYTENIVIPPYKHILINPSAESGRNLNITISPTDTSKPTITIYGRLLLNWGTFSISAASSNCIQVCEGGVFKNVINGTWNSSHPNSVTLTNRLTCLYGGIAVINSGKFYGDLVANGGIILLDPNNHDSGTKSATHGGLINESSY